MCSFRNVENDREASLFEVVRHAEITAQEDEQNSDGNATAPIIICVSYVVFFLWSVLRNVDCLSY